MTLASSERLEQRLEDDRAVTAAAPFLSFIPASLDAELPDSAPMALARARDILIALVAIIVLLPVLVLLSIAIWLDSPGPILFVHHRIGRGGRSFPCLKFRTMVVDSDHVLQQTLASSAEARAEWSRDHKLRKDPRVTRVGVLLRKTSLDELPQLLNIVAGHMSIVGPRPIVRAEIEKYGIYFRNYCSVRPGLTGLWQISGRNDVSYSERVRLDCEYVRTRSLAGDMAILARTVPAVLTSRGSY